MKQKNHNFKTNVFKSIHEPGDNRFCFLIKRDRER